MFTLFLILYVVLGLLTSWILFRGVRGENGERSLKEAAKNIIRAFFLGLFWPVVFVFALVTLVRMLPVIGDKS